uniref:GK21629 n=1 Tax=Drosophila willistoni TaxID=7260 RepID=B4MPC7_DROWI
MTNSTNSNSGRHNQRFDGADKDIPSRYTLSNASSDLTTPPPRFEKLYVCLLTTT